MNPLNRTLMFAGIAVASAVVAFVAHNASQPDNIDGFADVGQEFFPDFKAVGEATSLTVVDYDDEDRSVQTFSVQQNDTGLWVIPSHHDYPAEAADRLAQTATSLMGIKKQAVVSRNKADWKRYGVLPPDTDQSSEDDERGTQLTLADLSGNSLVDMVVGKKVPEQNQQYYVRVPEKNTTYIAELNVDLSAKFSDWIEPDLLKIETTDLVSVTLDRYSIDEGRGVIIPGEILQFQKQDLKTDGKWAIADLKPETEELDDAPILSLATNLNDLEIVDVRPKPEGLGDDMRINPIVKQILQQRMMDLGYFVGASQTGSGEQLYSNEGELLAGTNQGVQYTLYFGEIAGSSGKDIETGLDGNQADGDQADGDQADGEKAEGTDENDSESTDGPRRYLLVKVDFNDKLLGPKPVAPQEPTKPEILTKEEVKETDGNEREPEFDDAEADQEESIEEAESESEDSVVDDQEAADAEMAAEGDDKQADDQAGTDSEASEPEAPEVDLKAAAEAAFAVEMNAYKTATLEYHQQLNAWEATAKEGQEKVDELAKRFSGWYYVISSDSFEKFRLSRKDVVSEKKPEADSENPPAGETTDLPK